MKASVVVVAERWPSWAWIIQIVDVDPPRARTHARGESRSRIINLSPFLARSHNSSSYFCFTTMLSTVVS